MNTPKNKTKNENRQEIDKKGRHTTEQGSYFNVDLQLHTCTVDYTLISMSPPLQNAFDIYTRLNLHHKARTKAKIQL